MEEELKSDLKQIALSGGEKLTKTSVDTVIKMIEEIVKNLKNSIADAAFEFVENILIPKLYEAIDKIDGIEGNS